MVGASMKDRKDINNDMKYHIGRINFARGISCLNEKKYREAYKYFEKSYGYSKSNVESMLLMLFTDYAVKGNLNKLETMDIKVNNIVYEKVKIKKKEVKTIWNFIKSRKLISLITSPISDPLKLKMEYLLFVTLNLLNKEYLEPKFELFLEQILEQYSESGIVNYFAGYYYNKRKRPQVLKVVYYFDKYIKNSTISKTDLNEYQKTLILLIDVNLKIKKVKTVKELLERYDQLLSQRNSKIQKYEKEIFRYRKEHIRLKKAFEADRDEIIDLVTSDQFDDEHLTQSLKSKIVNLKEYGIEICYTIINSEKVKTDSIIYLLGVIYASIGNYREAISQFKNAFNVNKQNYRALIKAAYCYHKSNLKDFSLLQIKRILNMKLKDDEMPDMFYSIGNFFINIGDNINSKIYLNAALAYNCTEKMKIQIAILFIKTEDSEKAFKIIKEISGEHLKEGEDNYWKKYFSLYAKIFIKTQNIKDNWALIYKESNSKKWEIIYPQNEERLSDIDIYKYTIGYFEDNELFKVNDNEYFIPYFIRGVSNNIIAALIIKLKVRMKTAIFKSLTQQLSEKKIQYDIIAKNVKERIITERQVFNYNRFVKKLADPFELEDEGELIYETLKALQTRTAVKSPTFYLIVRKEKSVILESMDLSGMNALPNIKIKIPPETAMESILSGIVHGDYSPKAIKVTSLEKNRTLDTIKVRYKNKNNASSDYFISILKKICTLQFLPIYAKNKNEEDTLYGIIILAFSDNSPFNSVTLQQMQASISSYLNIIKKTKIFRSSYESRILHSVGASNAEIFTSTRGLRNTLRKSEEEKVKYLNAIDRNAENISLSLQSIKAAADNIFNSHLKLKVNDINECIYKICNNIEYWFSREGKKLNYQQLIKTRNFTKYNKDGIKSIIENLLRNSYEATSQSDQTFVKIYNKSSKWTKITIIDEGYGINKSEKQKILKRNFTTKPHGLGIGLNIVDDLAKKHHGKMLIHTPKYKGFVVTIYLPKMRSINE